MIFLDKVQNDQNHLGIPQKKNHEAQTLYP